MNDEIEEVDSDPQEMRSVREDWCRRNMEDIRSAVTRGATGVEASYFVDQNVMLSHPSTGED